MGDIPSAKRIAALLTVRESLYRKLHGQALVDRSWPPRCMH